MASQSAPTPQNPTNFLSLAPDTRNQIYDLVYNHHKRTCHSITVCSEKGYREIPHAISRTCRQIRTETLAYFYDLKTVIFVIRHDADLSACREWISFVPEAAWALIRGIRFRHTHCDAPDGRACSFAFELDLERALVPANAWWDRRVGCGLCNTRQDREGDCVPMVDLVLKEMSAGGVITRGGVEVVMDLFGGWTGDGVGGRLC